MRRHLRELASAGETPEPHTPLIPGAMYGGDGVVVCLDPVDVLLNQLSAGQLP